LGPFVVTAAFFATVTGKRVWAAAAVVTCLFGAPLAGAAGGENADALIQRGVELRRSSQDAEARKYFEQAYALQKSPKAAAQVGFAEQALGRWGAADRHLQAALTLGNDPWIRKNRAAIENALQVIARHVGRLDVSGTPAGAEIRIDGELVGRLPLSEPVSTTAGGVAIEVRAPGYVPIVRATSVGVGALARENFELQALSPAQPAAVSSPSVATSPPPAATVSTPPPPEPAISGASAPPHPSGDTASDSSAGMSGRRILTLSLGGAAVAALAFGIVEHLGWQSKVSSFDNAGTCDASLPDDGGGTCASLHADGQRDKTLAFVGYGLAVGFAATAALLYFTEPSSGAGSANVACAPLGAGRALGCALRF
jgi:hypothetical protein